MGMMQLLDATALDAHQRDYIATAQTSANHLLSLLNDILDVSALESGNLTLSKAPVALRQIFLDVRALMEPQALAKGLHFVGLSDTDALPSANVDAKRLKQIVFNLVGNAIKFTEQGSVTLAVHINGVDSGNAEMVLHVTDTGIGMDEMGLKRLFQRFYQADAGTNRKFGGTGLGLEISQSLATMMGGNITVRSQLGQGSTFTLRVPIELCEAVVSAAAPVPVQVPVALDNQSSRQTHVLVVEDHPINRKLVGALLGRMGCLVTFCEDGQQAVDAVQAHPFDAILMDVNMPVMDGLTATRTIRAMASAIATIPIIVFTADVMNEAKERASAAGANDFLAKPVQIANLRATLQKYVSTELKA
jgi:CheY-like chemotaxis protein